MVGTCPNLRMGGNLNGGFPRLQIDWLITTVVRWLGVQPGDKLLPGLFFPE
ncbi:hypothetical protein [Desulfonatronum thiosulfatophilum]|uniref:hypothetical protein n=1 Tax=Desulfonatronum thiosulfatophilum TaxID=617002 RepID=UPI001294675C|nr:hypothetical protein [Desulfonatronum thiosulfatophilum]